MSEKLFDLPVLDVPIERLRWGGCKRNVGWFNFEHLDKSWAMLDRDPDVSARCLPMWKVKLRVYRRFYPGHSDIEGFTTKWVNKYRLMYFDIRDNGFDWEKSNREKPISCRVDGYGRFFVVNGHHRVSILRHLGVQVIPVTIKSRDRRWKRLKRGLFDFYGEKKLYQPVGHPDFGDWVVAMDCEDTFQRVAKAHISFKDSKVLDIGCCTGWYSFRFARLGAKVVGVDRNREKINVCNRLRKWNHAVIDNPLFFHVGFVGSLENIVNECFAGCVDHLLFLNVFHHTLREYPREKIKGIIEMLCKLTDNLYLETSQSGLKKAGVTPADVVSMFEGNFLFYELDEGAHKVFVRFWN